MRILAFRYIIALILTAWMTIPSQAAEKTAGNPETVIEELAPPFVLEGEPVTTTRLTDRMKELNIPGFSIAVIRNGTIDWAKGYGTGVTINTLYQAASISKSVTAVAIMHLVQEGAIDLDSDANNYLKSWKIPKTKFNENKPVTVRMLLNHTAGLTRGIKLYAADEPVPTLLEILKGEKPAGTKAVTLDNEAGKDFLYTDNGYAVLQVLLEDLTGMPFADFMKKTALSPLGMTHSRYEQPLLKELFPQAAMPIDRYGKQIEKGPYAVPILAAGGLWTTASDLATFAVYIQDALAGRFRAVISQKTARQMLEPGKGDYGLGFFVKNKPLKPYFTHGGNSRGYQCELLVYEQGDGVVVLTSSENGFMLIDDIVHTLARAYGWTSFEPLKVLKNAKSDPKSLDGLVGEYRFRPGFPFRVAKKQDRLFIRFLEQEKVELLPQGNNAFFLKAVPQVFVSAQLNFILGDDGKAQKVIIHTTGEDDIASRLASIALRGPDAGVKKEPVRLFFDPKRKYNLSYIYNDSARGASSVVKVKGESIEWDYATGVGWGCGFFIPSNVPPLGDSGTVDLRGYRYLCFDAKLDTGKSFEVHINEYKPAESNLEKYDGVNGSDAESFIFERQKGIGKWSAYRIDLTDLDLRSFFGNQKGNRIFDLQSICMLDFQMGGGQGKGVMEIKRVRFEKE